MIKIISQYFTRIGPATELNKRVAVSKILNDGVGTIGSVVLAQYAAVTCGTTLPVKSCNFPARKHRSSHIQIPSLT